MSDTTITNLPSTASESDLVATSYIAIDVGSAETKKLPGNCIAPKKYGTNEIANLPDTITAFRTGDVIPVDGPSGTAKMTKDALLAITSESAKNNIELRNEVIDLAFKNSVVGSVIASGTGNVYSPVKYVVGATYKFENVGTENANVYLMKSESSSPSEISVTIGVPLTPGSHFEYTANGEEEEFKYISVWSNAIGGIIEFSFDGGAAEVKTDIKLLENITEKIISNGVQALKLQSNFTPIVYVKGGRYKFTNVGTTNVMTYLTKSKSTASSEIVASIGAIQAGESKVYDATDVEFSYLSLYGAGDNGIIKVEQLISNEALKENVDVLNGYFDKTETFSENLFDRTDKGILYGGYLSDDGETVTLNSSYNTSAFISVSGSTDYQAVNLGGVYTLLYWYDAHKSPIEMSPGIYRVKVPPTGVVTSPATAAYCRFAFLAAANIDKVMFGLKSSDFSRTYPREKKTINSFRLPNEAIHYRSFSVVGDSYSTFSGYLAESDYISYYSPTSSNPHLDNGVKDTWWYRFATAAKCTLHRLDSYSGATISNDTIYGISSQYSFVNRIKTHLMESQVADSKADVIFIFGGTNDNTRGTNFGTPKYSGWTDADLMLTLPALCFCVDALLNWSVGSDIVVIINSDLSSTLSDGFVEIANHYKLKYVKLENIEKSNGHPTSFGMESICRQIIDKVVG